MPGDDPLIWRLLVLLVLIAINAFFAMTEIAVISVNDNKIRRMAEEGDEKAKGLLHLINEPGQFLSTIQVGVTFAGFLASAYAADSFSDSLAEFVVEHTAFANVALVDTICLVLITILLSYVTLVFGELVPKQIGMHKAESIAFGSSGAIRLIGRFLKPFVFILTKSCNLVLRLFGVDPDAEPEHVTEEEIRMMVDIGEEKGSIARDEKELITNVFEFNNKEAADVMTHRTDLYMLWIDDTPEEIQKEILESGFTRYPVYDEDHDDIIGILHLRDYLSNMLEKEPKPLRELLRPAYFVPEQVPTDVLFRDMQQKKIHIAVVVDEYGGTRGVVTMEDLVEEIVGNIYDEYDETPQTMQQIDEKTWRLPGSTELEELEELFDVRLPQDEVDTLGGLVFSQLRTIPEDGSKPVIEAYGLRIQVEEVLDRRVEQALVSRLEKPEEETEEENENGQNEGREKK
ncbi:MAG: hemolysin family protein [Peptococcaceae bacterium]|nr:hemolysin family protein [Peptococcaceae bacterium]